MQQYKCIIVEDEPLAAEVLEDYIRQTPFLQLAGICSDAIYAMDLLQRENIDLVFLDIHLPKLKGLDFIKTLRHPPKVIIVSAYHEYALQGFELNVVDYLLKPVEYSRFLTAVNKVFTSSSGANSANPLPPERDHLFFYVSKKKVKIYFDEIEFIESLKEYIRISTGARNILTKMPLGEVEELLASHRFIRIHRSFIVARDKIDAFTATDVEIKGKLIPIGRSYKEEVLSQLESKSQNIK